MIACPMSLSSSCQPGTPHLRGGKTAESASVDARNVTTTMITTSGSSLVFVNGAHDGIDVPCVSVDKRDAGFLSTRHLVALGHRRIGSFNTVGYNTRRYE